MSLFTFSQAEAQALISSKQETFTKFFQGKIPTEELYKEYLIQLDLEGCYQLFLEDRDIVISRRAWYLTNFAQCHNGWRDEFDKVIG